MRDRREGDGLEDSGLETNLARVGKNGKEMFSHCEVKIDGNGL
jgi:hypothetical protein